MRLKHEFVNIKSNKSNYKIIDDLIKDTGFPLISTTNLAINAICKKVREDGFRVLISGNGADEIFSGYYAHHLSLIKKNENYETNYDNWVKIIKPHIRTEALKNINMLKISNLSFNFETNIYEKYFKIIKKEKNF